MYGREQEIWREFERAWHEDKRRLAAEETGDYRTARRAKARATQSLDLALNGTTERR